MSIAEAKVMTTRGKMELDLKPITYLPSVSVLTITKNREQFFSIPIRNWHNFKYPKDHIEWVIIDDSKTDSLKANLPPDNRIHYHHLSNPLPIADKRNYGVKKCKGEIIVHMDDDDFYFDDSVLAKVRILLDNPDKDCVFSLPLGIHDIISNHSAIANSAGNDIPEASMAYRKSFWKKGKFASSGTNSEWHGFCATRMDRLIKVPFWFNIIATTHTENATGNLRRLHKQQGKAPNFNQVWGGHMTHIVNNIRLTLKK